MSRKNLPKVTRVESALTTLSKALQQLDEHGYASAHFTVGIAKQALGDLQLDFAHHFQIERTLKQLLKQSPK